jgi:cold shock protein
MQTGKVKWFNNAKGYGFILADSGNEDLFAHYSSIQMDGYKTLKAGQAVCFDTKPGDKGTHAINIQAVETVTSNAPQTENADKVLGSPVASEA